jgi:excisionase family DNA binding protein
MAEDDNLTLKQAAEIANRDASTMRRAIERKVLKATKYGTTWVVRRKDLQEWMQSDSYNDNMRRR